MKKKRTPVVPKDLKPFVVRKFRTKDRLKRILVVRRPKEEGFDVQSHASKGNALLRQFLVPSKQASEIPVPVWVVVQRELAIWYARMFAKYGQPPPTKQEGGRRRRLTKKALAIWQKHQATKEVADRLNGRPAPPPLRKPQVLMPYIFFYNPKCRRTEPVFTVHVAHCPQLDKQRRVNHRKGGTSWVVEAKSPAEALRLQLEEFVADDKGYDASDFDMHRCGSEDL